MLIATYAKCHTLSRYAVCRYAKYRYAVCRYAECRGAFLTQCKRRCELTHLTCQTDGLTNLYQQASAHGTGRFLIII
jgi:hypothetical protein